MTSLTSGYVAFLNNASLLPNYYESGCVPGSAGSVVSNICAKNSSHLRHCACAISQSLALFAV